MTQKKRSFKFSLMMPYGYNKMIHVCVLLLGLFGVIMVTSASMTKETATQSSVLWVTLIKEIIFFIASYILMTMMARNFRLRWFRRYAFQIGCITAVVLLIPAFFAGVGGAKAWIPIPLGPASFSIQPSEFAKIIVVLLFASYCSDVHNPKYSAWDILKVPVGFLILYVGIIVVIQSDLGSALVMMGMAFMCLMVSSHPAIAKVRRIVCVVLVVGVVAGIWLMTPSGLSFLKSLSFLPEHYYKRFSLVANPFLDRYETGFQLIVGMLAFARGGLTGVGFGQSLLKYRNLTAAQTDMILAITVEEMGFLFGFLPILIGYSLIIFQNIKAAFSMRYERDKIVLVGAASYLIMHFILNVGGVSAVIPLTGVPLLFISYGGTSLMSIFIMMGIAQAIISNHQKTIRKQEVSHADHRRKPSFEND